jgi:hypothetical protein
MGEGQHSTTTFLVTAVIVVGVLAVRMSRARKAQPMNMRFWWAWPSVLVLLLGGGSVLMLSAAHADVDALHACIMTGVLALGCGVGWWRGRFMTIELDPATRKPLVRASGAALAVLGGLFVVRTAAKMIFFADADPRAPSTALLNVDFALFGLGVLAVARVEMWLRARRLLATPIAPISAAPVGAAPIVPIGAASTGSAPSAPPG